MAGSLKILTVEPPSSMDTMATAAEIGERELIRRIMKHLTVMEDMPIPFWDDVSAISMGDGRAAILKTDMLVWETDIPRGMTPFQAARKTVIMNFSDIGSKGVQPIAFLASLGLPRTTPVEVVEEMAKGFEAGAREHNGYTVGGDTNEACDIIIGGMAYGLGVEDKLIRRDGAKPGDILATTGSFGDTSSAFKILLEGADCPKKLQGELLKSVYMPRARVREGIALADSGAATSCIDSSDGLAMSLHDLSQSSGVGFRLTSIPVTEEATKFAEYNDLDGDELALYGGEEYELIYTLSPQRMDEARAALSNVGGELHILGRAIRGDSITYVKDGRGIPVEMRGWEHFSAEG
jgi:thiamine-monophosphate kinase